MFGEAEEICDPDILPVYSLRDAGRWLADIQSSLYFAEYRFRVNYYRVLFGDTDTLRILKLSQPKDSNLFWPLCAFGLRKQALAYIEADKGSPRNGINRARWAALRVMREHFAATASGSTP